MKNLNKILIFAIVICMFSCSYEKEQKYPSYEYEVGYYCPDSNKSKMNTWITETIRATDQHLNAGDYEDPEDVIKEVRNTANDLFEIKTDGLKLLKSEYHFSIFIPVSELNEQELFIYKKLKKEYNDRLYQNYR